MSDYECCTGVGTHTKFCNLTSRRSVTVAGFQECDTCRVKPGSPVLCGGCLANRATIEGLTTQKSATRPSSNNWKVTFVRTVEQEIVLSVQADYIGEACERAQAIIVNGNMETLVKNKLTGSYRVRDIHME